MNGVDAFFNVIARKYNDRSNPLLDKEIASSSARNPAVLLRGNDSHPRAAAIGPKTATALVTRGVTPDFVPDEYVAEAILPGLGDLRGRWVLMPRAEIARKALPEAIVEAGGVAHEFAVYQTLQAEIDQDGLAALKSGVEAVTFTSPSTVENFVEVVRRAGLNPLRLPQNPKIVCIGPITQKAAEEVGFTDVFVAEEYTTEGIVKLLRVGA